MESTHRRAGLTPTAFLESLEARIVLSPLTWTPDIALPSPRGGAVAVNWGDSVLILGGGTTTANWLGPASSSWRTATDLDLPRSFPGVAALGSEFLVYGGSTGHTPLPDALSYVPSNADLTQDAAPMSTARAHLGSAGDGTFAYAIGGLNESNVPVASAERYNPDNDAWSPIAPLPQALWGLSAVSDGAGHLFTFGGETASGAPVNAVYRYTVASNHWDALPMMPVAEHDGAAVLGPNGKIYVLGGIGASGAIATVQTYDLSSGIWATETSLPYAVSSPAAVTDSLGHVLVIGGFDAGGMPLSTVTVSQRLNAPDQAPVFTSALAASTSVVVGNPFGYHVTADANPQATFSLISAPQGMAIDPVTGQINFTPGPADIGKQTVTVRASNFAGQADQTFSFNVLLPAPTNMSAHGVGPHSIALSWSAPDGVPADGYYRVYERHFIHDPHGSGGSYYYSLLGDQVTSTGVTISGYNPGTIHTFVVEAATPSGAASVRSAPAGAQTYTAPTQFAELLLIAQNYGRPGSWAQGDLNGDGTVDFTDLLMLGQTYSAP